MPDQGQLVTTPSGEQALVVNINAGAEPAPTPTPAAGPLHLFAAGTEGEGEGGTPAIGGSIDESYLSKLEAREDAQLRHEGQAMGYVPPDPDPFAEASKALNSAMPQLPAAEKTMVENGATPEAAQPGTVETPEQPAKVPATMAAPRTWADDLADHIQLESTGGPVDQVWKSIARTGVASFRGFAAGTQHFFQSLDDLATTVSDATGLPKGGLFNTLAQASDYWVKQSDKLYDLSWDRRAQNGQILSYDKFMTGLVGDIVGGALPGMTSFVTDKAGMAAVKGYARDGITGAVTDQAKTLMLGKALDAAQSLPYVLRAAGMGGMFAADAYSGGETDPTKLAAAVGTGAGMAAMAPQAPPKEIRPVTPYEAAQVDLLLRGKNNLDEVKRAEAGGEITPEMSGMLRFFAHLFPDRDAATSLRVVNELMQASDAAMAAAGMPGQPGRIVGGVRISRQAAALKAALEFYQGADVGTVVHENAHLFFDKMPAEAKEPLQEWYRQETAGQANPPIFDEFVAEKFTDWFLKNKLWLNPASRADGFGGYFGQAANRVRTFLDKVMGVEGAMPPRDVLDLFRQAATGESGDVFSEGMASTSHDSASFMTRAEVQEWGRQLESFAKNEFPKGKSLTLGRTPKVLRMLGAADLNMVMPPDKVNKVLKDKHKISLETMKELPRAIADPYMVFDSTQIAHSYVVLTDLVQDGKPIISAIHLGIKDGRIMVNEVASAYGKDNLQGWLRKQSLERTLRYVNKTKTSEGQRSSGLQLPKEMTFRGNGKILTEKDVVNPFDENMRPKGSATIPGTDGKDLTVTPEFKQWSGGAPVVSREVAGSYDFQTGQPVVVEALHGTLADVEAFDSAKESPLGPKSTDSRRAIYFTSSPGVAGDYAGFENLSPKMQKIFKTDTAQEPGGNIVPAYVSMKNPLVVDAQGASYSASAMAKWVRQAREGGHDGLVVRNIEDSMYKGKNDVSTTYAVFNPTQVKSVFNRGTFDPTDPHISHAVKLLSPTSQWENLRSWEKVGDETRPWEIVDKAAGAADTLVRDQAPAQLPHKAVNINLDRLKTPDDIKNVIAQVGEALRPEMDEARRYTRSDALVKGDALRLLADDMGMTEATLLQRGRGEAFNAEQAVAARMILVSSANDVMRMARAVRAGNNSDASLLAFRQRVEAHAAIQAQVSGMAAEAGRALRSFRILAGASDVAPDIKLRPEDVSKIVEATGGRGDIQRLADTLTTLAETGENSVTQVGKAIADARQRTFKDWFFGYRYAAMLSGIPTHARNSLGNALVAIMAIPERFVASQLGITSKWLGSSNPEHVQAQEAGALLYGYLHSQVDALKLAGDAFRTGQSQFGPQKTEELGLRTSTTPVQKIGDFLWDAMSVPSRFLGAEDEYFKAINYRAELSAQAYRQASMEGLNGDALAARVRELMITPSEEMQRRSLDAAKIQTFNQDLTGPMRDISRGISSSFIGRVFVPFLRTPWNIFQYTMARTPLAPVFADFRADWSAGGARAEMALSKMIVGSSLMSLATALVANGTITGGGPSSKGERNVWLQNFQPYSIKFGDTWYSYGNLAEPISTYFALSADYYDAMTDWKREWDQGKVTPWELSTALVKAFAKNLTDKTFLKGVADLAHALDDPDRYAASWLQSLAGSFVPSFLGNWANSMDPELKLVGGYLDAMLNRVPGAKSDLPPRRDIFGDSIAINTLGPAWMSPIRTKDDGDVSDIEREMLRLGMRVSMPRKDQTFQAAGLERGVNIELTPEEYSRLLDITGHETRFGNLKARLDDYVNAASYQRMAGKSDGPDGQAAASIASILRDAREMAKMQLLQETPRLQGRIRDEQVNQLRENLQ